MLARMPFSAPPLFPSMLVFDFAPFRLAGLHDKATVCAVAALLLRGATRGFGHLQRSCCLARRFWLLGPRPARPSRLGSRIPTPVFGNTAPGVDVTALDSQPKEGLAEHEGLCICRTSTRALTRLCDFGRLVRLPCRSSRAATCATKVGHEASAQVQAPLAWLAVRGG